jgi:hypothetical protein
MPFRPRHRSPIRILVLVAVGLAAVAALALGASPEVAVQVSENENSDGPARRAVTAVTASGQQLVVWHQEDYGKSELWGRIVDEQGAVVGEPFPVSRPGAYALNPAVTTRGRRNEFLVAWDGSIPGKGGGIVARRFSGEGTPLGEEFLLAEGSAQEPALAYGGRRREFVVVWSGAYPVDAVVYGARLPAGTTSTPEPFRIAEGDSDRFRFEYVSLAYDSRTGRYLTGWDETDTRANDFTITESHSFVRTLPANAGERLGRIHRLPRSKDDTSGYPELVYNRKKHEYVALFSGSRLRRVDANGRPYGRELGEGYRRGTGLGSVRVEDVTVRPEGGYIVLFSGQFAEEGERHLYVRRVSPALKLRKWTRFVAQNAHAYDGSLAYSRVQERTRAIWLQGESEPPPDPQSYPGWEIWTRGL